ncbi:MAG: NADH-quinone oxidoreductase subunit L [Halioglobus sp.]|nr:NADH-quinone oxidoreductase subunit L [Halioglobus sp.]
MLDITGGWLLPLIYFAGTLIALRRSRGLWRVARTTAAIALGETVILTAGSVISSWSNGTAVDKTGFTAALLVALLGWVIINYSSRYLAGEPNQPRFVRAMLFTLGAVSVLVLSQNLLVIAIAWSSTSIGLHFLLTHYDQRKTAQIVAHKKFLASRMAEVCLVAALVLVYQATSSLTLDGLRTAIEQAAELPPQLHWAAALFALAAILKSAQLPLHGWLIQVMEAPTPVSALLHAGVVNMGGFVLIRLAELLSMAPAAQAMLVIVGGFTAVLAGLVSMTRISIKVRLAWSTCAQMGFMLMEIGLGLYELALLHLVAHSLYKAHAFLSAGDTVRQASENDFLRGHGGIRAPGWYLAALLGSAALVAVSAALWQALLPTLSLPPIALAIVALGLAPLLWLEQGPGAGPVLRGCAQVLGLTQLYLLWHLLFSGLAPTATAASAPLVAVALLCFCTLYATQIWLRCHPRGRLARTLYPWAYCGFYLDETFTRLTFKLWPARLSPAQAQTLVHRNTLNTGDTP